MCAAGKTHISACERDVDVRSIIFNLRRGGTKRGDVFEIKVSLTLTTHFQTRLSDKNLHYKSMKSNIYLPNFAIKRYYRIHQCFLTWEAVRTFTFKKSNSVGDQQGAFEM